MYVFDTQLPISFSLFPRIVAFIYESLFMDYFPVLEGGFTSKLVWHLTLGIDNKLYYWICLLPFVPSTFGRIECCVVCPAPWGRYLAADGDFLPTASASASVSAYLSFISFY